MRSQFAFYKSFDDVYQDLNNNQKLEFINTILDVQFLRKKIDDVIFNDNLLKHIWNAQKHSIKKSIQGYLDSQSSSQVKNPFLGCYEPSFLPSQLPSKGVRQEEQGEEQEEGEEKGQVIINATLRSATLSLTTKKDTKGHSPYKVLNDLNDMLPENIDEEVVEYMKKFIEYRDEMFHSTGDRKYALKTYRSIQGFINQIFQSSNIEKAFELMEDNEWASYKIEYETNKKGK